MVLVKLVFGGHVNRAGRSHSLDLSTAGDAPTQQAHLLQRGRRASIDVVRSTRNEHVLASSVAVREVRLKEAVVIADVGQACDYEQQRRILEDNYNRTAGEASVCDEQDTHKESQEKDCLCQRSVLEQRWEALGASTSGRSEPDVRRGRRVGRSTWRRAKTASPQPSRRNTFRSSSSRSGRRGVQLRSQKSIVSQQKKSSDRMHTAAGSSTDLSDQKLLAKLKFTLDEGRLQSYGARVSTKGEAASALFDGWGNTGVLSRAVEAELARIVQLGLKTELQLAELQLSLGRLPTPEEAAAGAGLATPALLQVRQENRQLARLLLIQYNLRLVLSVAKRFTNRGIESDDLIMEGTQGLERAIDRFDPTKGYKFSTYAFFWIRQAISRCISENSRVVRLPSHVFEAVGRISRMRTILDKKRPADQRATDAEIGAALGLSADKVAMYSQASKDPKSLEEPVPGLHASKGDTPKILAEVLEDSQPTPLEEVSQLDQSRVLKADIDRCLSGLSLRERNILRYRYGLHTEAMSLADLSAAYGLTKERIRQIADIALAKLQLRQAARSGAGSSGNPHAHTEEYGGAVLRPDQYGLHVI